MTRRPSPPGLYRVLRWPQTVAVVVWLVIENLQGQLEALQVGRCFGSTTGFVRPRLRNTLNHQDPSPGWVSVLCEAVSPTELPLGDVKSKLVQNTFIEGSTSAVRPVPEVLAGRTALRISAESGA